MCVCVGGGMGRSTVPYFHLKSHTTSILIDKSHKKPQYFTAICPFKLSLQTARVVHFNCCVCVCMTLMSYTNKTDFIITKHPKSSIGNWMQCLFKLNEIELNRLFCSVCNYYMYV